MPSRVRRLKSRVWKNVDGGQVDPTAYEVRLPSGKESPSSSMMDRSLKLLPGDLLTSVWLRVDVLFRSGPSPAARTCSRWRNIWPSPQKRRRSSGVCPELHRKEQTVNELRQYLEHPPMFETEIWEAAVGLRMAGRRNSNCGYSWHKTGIGTGDFRTPR
jgi:hypothetical protein